MVVVAGRRMFSYVRTLSQAVLVATSQVVWWHMRTGLNVWHVQSSTFELGLILNFKTQLQIAFSTAVYHKYVNNQRTAKESQLKFTNHTPRM